MVDAYLYMYEYGALRPVEVIIRRGAGRIMEKKQTGVHCIYGN
jgi:hypothetical protein